MPVNARFKARELEYVIRHSGMRILVAEPFYADVVAEARARGLCRVVIGTQEPGFVADAEGVDDAPVLAAQTEVGGDDDGLMLYTSGTTANPKGCVLPHAAIVAEGDGAERLASRRRTASGRRCRSSTSAAGGPRRARRRVRRRCSMRHFEPDAALDQLEHERVTIAFPAFETIWLAILDHPRFPEADLSALRIVIKSACRAAATDAGAVPKRDADLLLRHDRVGGFACIGDADDSLEARSTTCGRPLPGHGDPHRRPGAGADLPPGGPGELLSAARRVRRLLPRPGEDGARDRRRRLVPHRRPRPLDAGRPRQFLGRLKDMLKVGGENVSAAEIEGYLLDPPRGRDRRRSSARPTRATARCRPPSCSCARARGHRAGADRLLPSGEIATFKVPRYVRFVDEWPMSATKIQKFALRERIAAELREAGITEAPRIPSQR